MTRAHTLTSLVYTSAVLNIRFFFFKKQETSEKEKKKNSSPLQLLHVVT